MTTTAPILVIGSTGKTGSRITRLLEERGHAVRPGARSAPIPFDWEKSATWAPALQGVSSVYISYFPDLAFPGAAEKIEALTELAAEAGVTRLVLLSGRGEHHAQRCENIVRDSGLDYTLVRCAWFAQNFSEGYLREIPIDPITESRDTWDVISATGPSGESGVFNVKSGSEKTSLNGTPYGEW